MNATSISRRSGIFGLVSAILLSMFAFGQTPARAATETARVVKYAQNDIVPVKAKLRFSTLIILPEKEEILAG